MCLCILLSVRRLPLHPLQLPGGVGGVRAVWHLTQTLENLISSAWLSCWDGFERERER